MIFHIFFNYIQAKYCMIIDCLCQAMRRFKPWMCHRFRLKGRGGFPKPVNYQHKLCNLASLTFNLASLTPNLASLTPNLASLTPNLASLTPNLASLTPNLTFIFDHIHAAPRQGPPAPRSQGVISASVVVAPGQI